ncbi:glycoside hydrolase family 48 protein [Streptomyces sp. HPF1205]|uniref:glycoside hydrolase family 48 protein n=1 Tax=Streptomyces sp. HPF1205 TaxID=2873262 RepID=UPI001CEDFF91|nr:glycoside hydrolase family 48 protein [Streptomyces sp. HPF1205]
MPRGRPFRKRTRRLATALAAALAIPLAMTAAGGGSVAHADTLQCSVDYSTNDWGSGFTANAKITNLGSSAIDGWTLTYSYTGNQTLQSGWNGTWSQSGKNVTVKSLDWNKTIAAGGNVTTSANFNYSGSNTAPTSFSVNGTVCGGAHQPPLPVLTSPAAGATYSAGATIPLAATAVAADSATITKVEFYSNDTLLATDTTAPYSFDWPAVAAGDYSVYAKAYDSLGASAESTPVGIHVASGPSLVVSPSTLTVQQGKTGTFGVKLSSAPSGNVTVAVARKSGNTGLSVSGGAVLTFTSSNWSTAQNVTLAADSSGTGAATFSVNATGYSEVDVTATEIGAASDYDQRFLTLYNKITDPANGYFSKDGIPYHSVETLIVEAPDYGHETTSEAYSYMIWLQAMYGQVSGDWSKFNAAWATMEKYMIPQHADQPTNSFYNASKPATYAPEHPLPSDYPSKLDSSVPVGVDPIAAELKAAYGTDDIYGMHWLEDVDNIYGYGDTPGGGCETGSGSGPSYINTFQRGSQESVWETVPQPTCDAFKFGGTNGYLDLFTGDSSYSKQWKYTDAPDADARAIQAAYWADTWAKAQGKESDVSATVAKAGKMGDYLRYSFFDKYFKKIGNCTSPTSCAAGTGKDSEHYLLSWYYAWGGSSATSGGWAWRIGDSAAHFGYQNPLAAYALTTDPAMAPKSATGKTDWTTSLQRQLEFYQWLQSSEGAIAGGATNSWDGAYAQPPSGDSTFYGMAYDWEPVYHDPPSNQWFGMQTWSMERLAEYYQQTGNATAKAILAKWVKWAISQTTINADGTFQIPSDLQWTGQPDTWNPSSPGTNAGLHVTVSAYGTDLGVAASLAKTLAYYAAKSGDTAAQSTAKALLDGMWKNYQDPLGIATPETRKDYSRFNDPVYVPSTFNGTMPDGDKINSSSTFLELRSWYKNDPNWSKVQAYLNGGTVPSFTYHRFWAQADIAMAMGAYALLFNS